MFGHFSAYSRLSTSHFSRPGSVSGLIASRALGLAHPAVDALVGVDDEHVLALVEAVDRAYLDAIGVLALDAAVVDDIGHRPFHLEGGSATTFAMALRPASTLIGREADIALRRVHLQPEARQGAGKTDQR